jgi:hypothetical protein
VHIETRHEAAPARQARQRVGANLTPQAFQQVLLGPKPGLALALDTRQAIRIARPWAARPVRMNQERITVNIALRTARSVICTPKPMSLRPRKRRRADEAPGQESQQPHSGGPQRDEFRRRSCQRQCHTTADQERSDGAAEGSRRCATGINKLRISPSIHQEWGSSR